MEENFDCSAKAPGMHSVDVFARLAVCLVSLNK